MKVSVIIPTYKPGSYIEECFDSLLKQNCSLDLFEVVVILNGEKEPYYNNIENYLLKSGLYYKLIYTDKKGVSNARNVGINYSQNKAEYIIFLDDDDKLSYSFISDCIAKANPHNVLIGNCKTFIDNDENGHEYEYGDDYITKCFEKNKNKEYNIFRYRSFFSTVCAKMIPLKIIGLTRFDTRYKLGEDALFCFSISKDIDKCVLVENDSIYYRRIREGSASRSKLSKYFLFKNYSGLVISYSQIYFRDVRKYNFLFYVSRVVATMIHFFRRM
ncbi:glycosyltransferase family 2 protein [Empedobacter stercoris]|uniref:Glycosyltransferase family 2 protein n=1 Tax=Empedobacter stercoris TaxID=1628248 RepID=A0ABX1WNS6_9FLAO|nr:glycosyltransferase family 2 protein [Empedobacter stercoris]NOJ76356.1 glycosyltransferase family 2 protein [Empedobacter stercoris]